MKWYRLAVPFALLLVVGCGATEEDRFKLIPVTGKVTKNGKPMAGATITFMPDASNKQSTPGVDSTGPEGNYSIRFKGRTGVAPGKYKVAVEPGLESTGKSPEGMENDPYMANLSRGNADQKKEAGEKSEFDAEVPDDKNVELDFDVKASTKK